MKQLKYFFWFVLLAFGLTAHAYAKQKEPLSAELLWELERIGAPKISSQANYIVAPVTKYSLETDQAQTQLWLFSKDGKTQRPLTAQGQRVSEATFSPDGNSLAFVSQRDKDSAGQIYILPLSQPGEAVRLTEVPTGTYGIKWVGKHLYFISKIWADKDWEGNANELKNKKESHVSAFAWDELPYAQFDHYLDETRSAHIFRISSQGGDIEAVSQPLGLNLMKSSQSAWSYDVSPDERWIAVVSDSLNSGVSPNPDIFLAEIGGKKVTNITADNRGSDSGPMFSPDGKQLAYTQQKITGFYADKANIALYNLNNKKTRVITEKWDRSASGLVWTPDSKGFYGAIDDAGTSRIYHIQASNGKTRAVTGETNYSALSIAKNGQLVSLNESFMYPPRVVSVNPKNGNTTRLDQFNDDVLARVDLGRYESVTYKGHNGDDVQMWVHYPPGFDANKKYPLFLLIHGGPHSGISNGFHFRWNAQTFASWGYVTAWHNFHGSSGFGQEFTDSINPDWVTAPYADTLAAAEWFQEKPWIDKERMVAGGGSYGGYLSSILLGKEHPFKALVIHAAVYNMYSQMSADFAVHSERFGNYWEDPKIYQDISPHYYAKNFNTPSLIIHGQKDLRVPVGQGFELFRTLQTRGVDSRMVYYPDENHWILKPNNSVNWYQEVRNWIEKYAEPGGR